MHPALAPCPARTAARVALAALLALPAACTDAPVVARRAHVDFAPPGRPRAPIAAPSPRPPEPRPLLLAFTTDGELAAVDDLSGERLATAATAPGTERDVSFDPWHGRVWVLGIDDEGGGELVAHAATRVGGAPVLGPPEHACWIDGPARVLATPLGPVLFERGYGQRWRLLRDDGEPSASVAAPVPRSAWLTVVAQAATVQALADTGPDDGAPARARAAVWPDGIGLHDSRALTPLGVASEAGRLAPAPALGGEVFAAPAASGLALARLPISNDGTLGVAEPAGVVPLDPIGSLERLAAIDRGRTLVALLADREPTAVAAIDLGTDGRVARHALAGIGGLLPAGRGDLERGFAVVDRGRPALDGAGARVAVGVDGRVHALDLIRTEVDGELELELRVDDAFDGEGLSGPLDLWTSTEP